VSAFFFKFILLSFNILCAISQSTYFASSYSGSLDRMLHHMKLSDECAAYTRRVAVIYTSIAWAIYLVNGPFTLYVIFFSESFMDIVLAPITVYFNLSDLLVPRIVLYLCRWHLASALIFPHTMSIMLATVFHHEFKVLSRSFDKMLAESDERRVSDSDIASLMLHYQRGRLKFTLLDDGYW